MTPHAPQQESAPRADPEPDEGYEREVPLVDRRIRATWIVVAVLVVAALAILGFFLLQNRGAERQLPDGFPSQAELPLVDGELAQATQPTGSQAEVIVRVAGEAQQEAALAELRAAGYRVIGSDGSGPVGTVTSLSGDTQAVRVEFGQDADGTFTVTYLVSPRPDGDADPDSSSSSVATQRATEESTSTSTQ